MHDPDGSPQPQENDEKEKPRLEDQVSAEEPAPVEKRRESDQSWKEGFGWTPRNNGVLGDLMAGRMDFEVRDAQNLLQH